jgi:hypothetical protein
VIDPKRETYPVQSEPRYRQASTVSAAIYLQAYEVYCHCYGPQDAMVTGGCRGGMGVGELVAFLYAYPFPREQWAARVREAFAGMKP